MAAPPDLNAYTRELLRFRLGSPGKCSLPSPDPGSVRLAAERVLRAWSRRKPPALLLLGLGSGALACALREALPMDARLAVSEPSLERARQVLASGNAPRLETGKTDLLADDSPTAHLTLWQASGLTRQNALALVNPELLSDDREAEARLMSLFSRAGSEELAPQPTSPPSIGFFAVISPSEPELEDFLSQVPEFVTRMVVVWDAENVPAGLPEDARRMDVARPLAGDFAAQRNHALSFLDTDWAFYLDADERLSFETWHLLPRLASHGRVRAWRLPRLTLLPEGNRARIGWGLWPDLQLRLFARQQGAAFERPVHERLTGLTGPEGIVVDAAIEHRQAVTKSEAELREKLALFDASGPEKHVLSAEYPGLDLDLLPGSAPLAKPARAIIIEER